MFVTIKIKTQRNVSEDIASISKIPCSLPSFSLCPEGPNTDCTSSCSSPMHPDSSGTPWLQTMIPSAPAGNLPAHTWSASDCWDSARCQKAPAQELDNAAVHNLHIRNIVAVIHSWAIELSMLTLQFQSETCRIQKFKLFTLHNICLPSHTATCNF